MHEMKKWEWLAGPAAFAAMLGALLVTWAVMAPDALVRNFDNDGRSPFEIATLFVYAAIIPFVWWKNPFGGSARRRRLLALAVSVVAFMAIVKELDLHIAFLRFVYPECVGADGSMAPGFFKPDGRPLTGTPFKMRVLTNAAVPLGMKACIVLYFALFFGLFAALFAWFLPKWIKGVFTLDAASWAWGCLGASGVVVQIADRLPSWLGHAHGLDKHAADGVTKAASLCTALEEGSEMMLAAFALMTIWFGWRKLAKGEGCG